MDNASNPTFLARETLKQLAALKIPPTPDNYHKLYNKIAGHATNVMCEGSCKILAKLAKVLPRDTPQLVSQAKMLERAAVVKNWHQYQAQLITALSSSETNAKPKPEGNINWAETLKKLLKHIERNRGALTVARKRDRLNRVLSNFANDSDLLRSKLEALMESWDVLESGDQEQSEIEVVDDVAIKDALQLIEPVTDESDSVALPVPVQSETSQFTDIACQLQALLAHILEYMAAAVPLSNTSLSDDVKLLIQKVHDVQSDQDLAEFIPEVKQFCTKFKSCGEQSLQLQQGLLGLLNSFIDSTESFLADDQWIKNQMTKIRETMSHPLDLQIVEQADGYLKELISKQSLIKKNLTQAQIAMKEMVACLIRNIEELSIETGEYHDKIENYSEQIQHADNIESLNELLVELMRDTRQMQESAMSSRSEFIAARAEVDAAQNKITQLETELLQMSEKVQEDHLTGTLNRRGLDSAFIRESVRATRQQTALCLAVLDIDDFKKLNDTYGHIVGDDVLVYLVNEIKNETRCEDVVARFGGEEFIILLPDTELDSAVAILTRIKRNLTKKFFLYENKRLLITFSAGVAKYRVGESGDDLVKRADQAMYRAKNSGKNQVLATDD